MSKKKKSEKTKAPTPRNFVAKNSHNMSGAGSHGTVKSDNRKERKKSRLEAKKASRNWEAYLFLVSCRERLWLPVIFCINLFRC